VQAIARLELDCSLFLRVQPITCLELDCSLVLRVQPITRLELDRGLVLGVQSIACLELIGGQQGGGCGDEAGDKQRAGEFVMQLHGLSPCADRRGFVVHGVIVLAVCNWRTTPLYRGVAGCIDLIRY